MAKKLPKSFDFDGKHQSFVYRFQIGSRKVWHYLDLTNQADERQLLDVIFGLHVFFFLITLFYIGTNSYVVTSLSVKVVNSSTNMMDKDYERSWINWIINILSFLATAKCVIILGLARKRNQTLKKLRFYLKWYKMWNMTVFPLVAIIVLYLRVRLLLSVEKWSNDSSLSIVLLLLIIIVKVYLVMNVVRTYHKLGSRVIERLMEHKEAENDGTQPQLDSARFQIPLLLDECSYNVPSQESKNKQDNDSQTLGIRMDEVANLEISNALFRDKIISPLSISIDTSKFIGEGQYGTVFTGTLRRNCVIHRKTDIAAKIVKNCESGDTLQMLLQEIKISILAGDHPYIVLFHGVSSDASLNAQCAIITELCEMGSLQQFLVNNRHTFVNMLREHGNIIYKDQKLYVNLDVHATHSSLDLMRFAQQIAVGMDHLSSRHIIHGDLAARNVLLTKDLTVKLSDFGMSRRLYNYQFYFNCTQNDDKFLPWRWMSYEAIKDLKFSVKSDVWAYGTVLWEIFTLGAFPFEKLKWCPDIIEKIESGMRLDRPAFAPEEMYDVMKCCWNLDPKKRPNFRDLRTVLTKANARQASVKYTDKSMSGP